MASSRKRKGRRQAMGGEEADLRAASIVGAVLGGAFHGLVFGLHGLEKPAMPLSNEAEERAAILLFTITHRRGLGFVPDNAVGVPPTSSDEHMFRAQSEEFKSNWRRIVRTMFQYVFSPEPTPKLHRPVLRHPVSG